MSKSLIFLAFILAIPVPSLAGSATDQVVARDAAGTKFVAEYLSRLKNERTAVFYGECSLKDGGKAGIVIPLGKKEGLYIERSSDKTVANTADLIWVDGQWQTEVAQGGVYTITRANNLIGEIMSYSFQFISPDKLDLIPTSKPKKACVERVPQ
ncbi:MAG: hypothetical protein HYY65_06120 [Candidatus Tectomicrobia bacterium]|uniref:Uncharacterized protein n=1 Tax=Tectimicrobiota bacterium TaxID=2528274 RepID=A0A932GP70_UNCTE|nr:hypothetical protein [Candidatus Tectomicrobia bacterium]